MKEKSKILLLFLVLMAFVNTGRAQIETMRNYVFVRDSVEGFDEVAASAAAFDNGMYGDEFKVAMYGYKRAFIKQKYHLQTPPPVDQTTLFQNNLSMFRSSSVTGGVCDNEDFELTVGTITPAANAVQGWLAQGGNNSNQACNPLTTATNANYTVYSSPIVDGITGLLISSYFDAGTTAVPAGNSFIRLNDQPGGSSVARLTKSFIVTSSNALFEYAYLPVIQDGSHGCCQQAGFDIRITVTNTTTGTPTVLACPQISVAVPGAACQFTPPVGSPTFVIAPPPFNVSPNIWLYHNWNASIIDLTPYIGNQVTLVVTVKDCDAGGHAAYSYFDAKCVPMDITGNGTPFPAGTPSVTLPSCGATSATMCAPEGTGPWTWNGPGVVAPYNVPSLSNQCYTTSISSNFTLTMNPPGSCNPIDRLITVTITAAPFVVASPGPPVCGASSVTITYTAAGSASVNPTVTWSPVPTSTTSNNNLGSATYLAGAGIVTLTVKDPLGCKVTTTIEVKPLVPAPTVTIVNVTGSPSITCKTPSVDLTASTTYTDGTLNYAWTANSFTATGDTINVTNASTLITVVATDPATGCIATATTSIKLNIVAPTITLSPVTQSIGCGAGVVGTTTGTAINPTTNVTHNWYSPGISVPQSNGGPVSIFNPSGGGGPTPNATTTYTYIVTNDINGCASTKTFEVISIGGVYPTFNVTCSQNFSIGCTTTSLTTINIVNPQAGGGGQTTFTLLPPNYTGGLGYSTGPSVTYTVNAPGNYTMIVRDPITQCETRLTVPILQDIFPPNISSAALTRTLSCYTPTVVLKGISINTPSVPITYEWSFTNGANPNVVNSFSVPVSINLVTALTSSVINTYSLKITNQNNACINNTVVTMWQNIRPPVARISPSISAISCLNGSVTMANQSTTGIVPNTFFISKPIIGLRWDGPSPQLPRDSSSSYSAFVPGTYSMTALDKNNGCTSKTTATVTDERDYLVLATTNTLVPLDCGSSTSGVKLPVTIVGNPPSSAYTATWYPPVPTPSVNGLNTLTLTTNGLGEYNLVVKTLSNSCVSAISIDVGDGTLTANFTADQLTGYAPLTVNFTNNSHSSAQTTATQSITSVWSYGNGTTKTTTSNINTSAVYTAPGTYSVTMFTTKGNCIDTAQQIIVVDIPSKLEVPNVFTPNGDGNNDLFFIKSANLTSITAQIFDRWGNKIYELSTDKGNIAWDGKNQQGKEVADGTYFYTIKAVGRDGQNYDTKGTVSLYR